MPSDPLVAGLFIPQWNLSYEEPYIIVADPSWEEVELFFAQTRPSDIKSAVFQINLAKHLSLIGLVRTAQFFAETPPGEVVAIPEQSVSEIRTWLEAASNGSRILFDSDNLLPSSRRELFRVEAKALLYDLLNQNTSDVLQSLSSTFQNRQSGWRFSESQANDTEAFIDTPLGFRFSLEIS